MEHPEDIFNHFHLKCIILTFFFGVWCNEIFYILDVRLGTPFYHLEDKNKTSEVKGFLLVYIFFLSWCIWQLFYILLKVLLQVLDFIYLFYYLSDTKYISLEYQGNANFQKNTFLNISGGYFMISYGRKILRRYPWDIATKLVVEWKILRAQNF